MSELPDNAVEMINARLGGFNQALGLSFVRATADAFVAQLEIGPHHLQPYGLVHGGVLAGMIETVCSTGAAVEVLQRGCSAVGLENSTSFLRAVRGGTLRCVARPLTRGRRTQVWEGRILDGDGQLVASGRVRLLVLEPGARADGEAVALKHDA